MGSQTLSDELARTGSRPWWAPDRYPRGFSCAERFGSRAAQTRATSPTAHVHRRQLPRPDPNDCWAAHRHPKFSPGRKPDQSPFVLPHNYAGCLPGREGDIHLYPGLAGRSLVDGCERQEPKHKLGREPALAPPGERHDRAGQSHRPPSVPAGLTDHSSEAAGQPGALLEFQILDLTFIVF